LAHWAKSEEGRLKFLLVWFFCYTAAMTMLTPDLLLRAYAGGVFPMAEQASDADVFWVEPKRRGIIPLDQFHVSRSLAKTVRQELFEVRVNTDFRRIMRACAESTAGRAQTWINQSILDGYAALHEIGHAHSVECWRSGDLVGGLYGVSLRGAFFGESMFSRARDASKVALVHLVARLKVGGFLLLDTQFLTDHLAQFGTREITRTSYQKKLQHALAVMADFSRLDQLASEIYSSGAGAGAGSGLGDGAGDAAASDESGLRAGFLADFFRTTPVASSKASPVPRFSSSVTADTSTVSGPLSGKLILHLSTQTS
jgi:leucyl/phenylalanyl-tRNA--protein transferase